MKDRGVPEFHMMLAATNRVMAKAADKMVQTTSVQVRYSSGQ